MNKFTVISTDPSTDEVRVFQVKANDPHEAGMKFIEKYRPMERVYVLFGHYAEVAGAIDPE
jgi:hypothetical protein